MESNEGETSAIAQQLPHRIGIILGSEDLDVPALKVLILAMNSLQTQFEFEFLPCPENKLISALRQMEEVDRESVRAGADQFVFSLEKALAKEEKEFSIEQPTSPDQYVIVSMATFSDTYYTMREKRLSVIALGDWERSMAPPSLLEFIQALLLREAIAGVCPALSGSMHLATRGCICDFTSNLSEARLKVLHGFVCSSCRTALAACGRPNLTVDVQKLLAKKWLGSLSEPGSTASVLAKLNSDLFLSTGLKPTFLENVTHILQTDGLKEAIKLISALALAGFLALLGWKAAGN